MYLNKYIAIIIFASMFSCKSIYFREALKDFEQLSYDSHDYIYKNESIAILESDEDTLKIFVTDRTELNELIGLGYSAKGYFELNDFIYIDCTQSMPYKVNLKPLIELKFYNKERVKYYENLYKILKNNTKVYPIPPPPANYNFHIHKFLSTRRGLKKIT